MSNQVLEKRIEEAISPSIENMGYELVRIRLTDGNYRTLQILAEGKDGNFGLEDCTKISRTVSAILDVEDIIPDKYNLEVSSPGLDRPLVKLKDYQVFAGKKAKITIRNNIDGRKRFSGQIKGVKGENIIIKVDDIDQELEIPFAEIEAARLLITDDILKKKK